MTNRTTLQEGAMGCLIGLNAEDAARVALELEPPGTFERRALCLT
jgi:hypothetical protein